MKKYCTRCGKPFEAVGREVICPACKEQAVAEAKKAAVMRAKRASWTGESVPVRISGRASTVIRGYGAANGLPFAVALDALLKASDYLATTGTKWEDVEPYRSHRRDKHTAQDAPQVASASKPSASKASTSKASKTSASKASKVSKPSASK